MATDTSAPSRGWFDPFVVLLTGSGVLLLAAILGPREVVPPVLRALSLFAGVGLIFHALLVHLRSASWDTFSSRVETSAFLAIAGATVGLNAFGVRLVERLNLPMPLIGVPSDWDAIQLLLAGAFLLLLSGTVVVLLPSLWRKVAISVWVVFHFLGMFVVFSSVDPPNSQGPWLAKQLWTVVYRPYLSYFYLTNAYHFYSPDPGPPTLLWFAIQYEDGSYSWVKVPNREKSPVGMHYQRLLALPEHTYSPNNRLAHSEQERLWFEARHAENPEIYTYRVAPERVWEDRRFEDGRIEPGIYRRRYNASRKPVKDQKAFVFPVKGVPGGLVIPWVADLDLTIQYREPTDTSRRLIASVSRRVLREAGPNDLGSPPLTVKAYRLIHNCLTPRELADGVDPYSNNKYWAYFLGEFDRDSTEPIDLKDPFLYWYLPMIKVEEYPKGDARSLFFLDPNLVAITVRTPAPKEGKYLNCLEMHAAGDLIKWNKKLPKEGK